MSVKWLRNISLRQNSRNKYEVSMVSLLVFVIFEDGLCWWKFQDLIIFITQDMLTYMSHTNTLPRYFIYKQTICLSRLHGCDATIIDFDILISRLILFPSIVVFVSAQHFNNHLSSQEIVPLTLLPRLLMYSYQDTLSSQSRTITV